MSKRRRRNGKLAMNASRRRPRASGKISAPRPDLFLDSPFLREAGVPITSETATQVSAVYGCCRLIVDSLASAPVLVYETMAKGRREVLFDDPAVYTLNWGAPVQQAGDAPPAQGIEEALFWSGLLDGNGYAEIQRDGGGKFFALWPIESGRVVPRREGKDFWYDVLPVWGSTGTIALAPMDMFHLRGPSLYGWVGDSTVYRGAKAIGIAQAAQVFSAAYYSNGTVISGLLSSDKIVTQAQADRAKEEWNKSHKGPMAAHGIAVTGQGLKFQAINHNAEESALVEAQRFSVQQIARFFGVPTTLLADNEAWTNLSELYLGFYRNALLPWAGRFDAEATRKLFPQRQPWREVKHDLTELVLGSFKERVGALREAVRGGLKTVNEARAILGDNTRGSEGDVLVMEGTVKSLEDVLAPPSPSPAPSQDMQGPPDDTGPTDTGQGIVKTAAALMYAQALERFHQRVASKSNPSARNWSLEQLDKDGADAAALLAAHGVTPPNGQLRKFAEYVEAGEPANLAASRMLGVQ